MGAAARIHLNAMSRFKRERELKLYQQQMGADVTERQMQAAARQRGGCSCEPRQVKKKWDGEFGPVSIRTLHQPGCSKWRWWHSEA